MQQFVIEVQTNSFQEINDLCNSIKNLLGKLTGNVALVKPYKPHPDFNPTQDFFSPLDETQL